MIEKAQRKLREARFFYNHLLNARRDLPEMAPRRSKDDPEAFRFYFSAIIQSARSVPWAIGKEEPDKWNEWKRKWEDSLSEKERKLQELTNELRLDEVHRGGADLAEELVEVVVKAAIDTKPRTHWERDGLVGGSASIEIVTKNELRPTYYFEDSEGKEETTAFCERYLTFLEKTVTDFIRDNG
jgi:hypothetical protein